jgi:hypothetical protein
VKERQHRDDAVILAQALVSDRLADVRDEVSVREHHTLGEPRRAAGVRQRDEIVGRVDLDLGRLANPPQQRRKRRRAFSLAVDEDLLHARRLRRRPRRVKPVGNRHHEPRTAVTQLACQLVGGE